jgi:type II secretory pathway pseudopilin PulG
MELDGQARVSGGYAMAGLLVALAVMAILMSVALPTWRQAAQREREEELIFRGKQYARAIELYQRKYANAFPQNFDVLVEQRFLRKMYKDPMVEDGQFQLLYQIDMQQGTGRQGGSAAGRTGTGGQARAAQASSAFSSSFTSGGVGGQSASGPRGGVIGVVSKSDAKSIRLYNGRNYYNEWQFVYVPITVGSGGISGGGISGGMQRGGRGSQTDFGGMGAGRGRGGRGQGGGPGFPGGRGGEGFPPPDMGPGGPQRGPGGGFQPGGGTLGPPRGGGRGLS